MSNYNELTDNLEKILPNHEKIVNVKVDSKKPTVFVLTRDDVNTRRGYKSDDGGKNYEHVATAKENEAMEFNHES